MAAIEVHGLTTQEEFAKAVELQKVIWGFSDIELLPVRLFVVATKVGGQAFGAFDAGRMVGFCVAIPGMKPGPKTYLHSHMLGVLKGYSNRGIGRMLKLAQRAEALERNIELIEWTFDPLEIKNAYFNIERLGAIIRRYVANQYGTTTSPLHGGLPTDRLTAEWWVATPRVELIVSGNEYRRPAVEAAVELPNDIAELRKSAPRKAREIQKRIGEQFQKHFSDGLAVIGLDRGDITSQYLLGAWK
jgi:predicted GNAT superfamily acetyltransferase